MILMLDLFLDPVREQLKNAGSDLVEHVFVLEELDVGVELGEGLHDSPREQHHLDDVHLGVLPKIEHYQQ